VYNNVGSDTNVWICLYQQFFVWWTLFVACACDHEIKDSRMAKKLFSKGKWLTNRWAWYACDLSTLEGKIVTQATCTCQDASKPSYECAWWKARKDMGIMLVFRTW
jgi:hypothetical protein